MMCHHGTLIVADSVAIAFDDLYYLERACMVQLLAMGAAGKDALKQLPPDIQVKIKIILNSICLPKRFNTNY